MAPTYATPFRGSDACVRITHMDTKRVPLRRAAYRCQLSRSALVRYDPNRKSITAFINHAGHVEVKKELRVYTSTKRFNDKAGSRKWEQIGWVGIF